MSKYLGITIGPIYATLMQARKTREVWLGSFFFSHVMKLILKFFEGQIKSKSKLYKKLYAHDTTLIENGKTYHGAGIFDDRCYVELHDNSNFIQEYYIEILESVYNGLESLIDGKSMDELKQYLQIYCTVQTVSEDESVLKKLNKALDNMELRTRYYQDHIYALASGYEEIKDKELDVILPNSINELKKWYGLGFDLKEGTDDIIFYENISNGVYSFPSILEIATTGLKRKGEKETWDIIHDLFKDALAKEMFGDDSAQADDSILEEIKENYEEYFQTAHKYIAVVHADGDQIGKLITKLDEEKSENLTDFSQTLSEFAIEASNIIHRYGGKPVYIGGDDLFFFAPVVSYQNGEDTNIFELIQQLDEFFDEKWDRDWVRKYGIHPSLSFGVSITYYKYPMNEAIGQARDYLLFGKAKEQHPDKNCVAAKILSHSGSFDEVLLNKLSKTKKKIAGKKGEDDSWFGELLKLLKEYQQKDRETVVSSILQRLRTDKAILLAIANDEDDNRFDAYFSNEYDLDTMREGAKKEYIKYTIKLFNRVFSKSGETEKNEQKLEKLCAIYRLLNFLIHKEDGK